MAIFLWNEIKSLLLIYSPKKGKFFVITLQTIFKQNANGKGDNHSNPNNSSGFL